MATPAVAWFEVTGKDATALQEFHGKLFDCQIRDAVGLPKGAVQ
jgi:hypothetical protein